MPDWRKYCTAEVSSYLTLASKSLPLISYPSMCVWKFKVNCCLILASTIVCFEVPVVVALHERDPWYANCGTWHRACWNSLMRITPSHHLLLQEPRNARNLGVVRWRHLKVFEHRSDFSYTGRWPKSTAVRHYQLIAILGKIVSHV